MSRVLVGTCSWSDHTNFYPVGLPANQQMAFYSQHYPIVEIDSTFYRMMPGRNFALWAERTPPGFVFDIKPFRQLTWHDRENAPTDEMFVAFSASMQPLRHAGKLGAVHFQFPPWFMYQARNVDYVAKVKERLATDRLSVEFRHRSWMEGENLAETIGALRSLQVSLTVVDEPQIGSGSVPTVLEVTNFELVIVCFHGRNYTTWYARTKTIGERFDYCYSGAELTEWVPQVRQLATQAREFHLLLNNQDYAVQNARQLRLLLEDLGA